MNNPNQKKGQKSKKSKPQVKRTPMLKREPKVLLIQNTNAPVSKGVRGAIPDAKFSAKMGKICVRHSELLGTISSSGDAFNVTQFPINPGLQNFTGWLSNVARNYESYKFKMLRFRYIAACPTTTSGQVYVTVDFDASDPAPLTEAQVSYYQGTRYSAPWNHQEYVCTSQNLSKRSSYYVRSSALAANQDVVLYDTGNLYICTVGTGAASLGKIWVEYEVEFDTPEFRLTPAGTALYGRLNGANDYVTLPTVTGNLPVQVSVLANDLILTSTAPYSGVMAMTVSGTGLTTISAVGSIPGNVSVRSQCVNAAADSINAAITFTFTAPGQTMTLSNTAPTSITGYNLRVGQYDFALV